MMHIPLGDICEFKYGKSLPESKRADGSVAVFGSNGRVGTHVEALTTGPTIIVGRKGSVGEITYSPDPCWPIDTTYYVDSSVTSQNIRWLYYALKSLRLSELNKATGVPGLNRNDAYERRLLLPELDDQIRAAAILDKAESIQRKRRRSLAMADELLKSGFLERFGDPLTNRMGLPIAPIKEFGRVITGNTPPRANPENYGSAIEWIKSDNINTPEHLLTEADEHLSEAGKAIGRTASAGSTLVTCIAGSPSVIGNAALTDREVAFNQQINAVVPNHDTDPYFLYCQFLVGKKLVQAHSTNSMKGMVSKGKFQEINFLKPSYDDQRRFGQLFQRTLLSRSRIRNDCLASQELIASLTTRAFRGEL